MVPLGPCGALSRRFLHLVTFYGISNRGNGAKFTQCERLLEKLLDYVSTLGSQPVLICADVNTERERSPVLQRALSVMNLTDLADHFSGGKPEKTFCASKTWNKYDNVTGATRPDLILANAAALVLCEEFTIRRDLPIKGHLGLQVKIRREACMQVQRVYVPPTPFPVRDFKDITDDKAEADFQDCFRSLSCQFQAAIDRQDTNAAWLLIARAGEKFLRSRCTSRHKLQGGRHGRPRVHSQHLAASAVSRKNAGDPHCRKLALLSKTLRQLSELKRKQLRRTRERPVPCDQKESIVLHEKIQTVAQKYGLDAGATWHACDTQLVTQKLQEQITQSVQENRDARLQAWRFKLRQSFDVSKNGDAAFAWLRSKPSRPITAITNADGDVVTSPAEVTQAVQCAWQKLFNKPQLVSAQSFLQEAQPCINEHPCEVPDINGKTLRHKIRDAKNTRAVALHGWRIPELQALPQGFFDHIATVIRTVEAGAP